MFFMKRLLILIGVALLVAAALGLSLTVSAAGDKVRGDEGAGSVVQVWVEDCGDLEDCDLVPWENPALVNK